MGSGVWGLGVGVLEFGARVQGLEATVSTWLSQGWGLGVGVWCLGVWGVGLGLGGYLARDPPKVGGLEFGVWGLGFGVWV